MSVWRIVTRELYAAGRPMQRDEFAQQASGADPYKGLRDAKRLGLVRVTGSDHRWLWEITDHGKAWVEGRVELHIPQAKSDTGGRAPGTHYRLRATWLMQLPATNEIRITA